MKRRIISLVVVVAFFSLPYFLLDVEKRVMDDNARKGSAGSYVRLKDGVVHYELSGPPSSRLVVLIHGGSVPYFIWDRTVPALVNAGYRVLRYDLFGRGFSDRPDVVYDRALYRGQLLDLLTALNIKEQIDITGVSMGAAIAADFTNSLPEKVRKLCLMNPVGFPVQLPASEKLMQIPFLGEYVFALIGPATMVSFVKKDFVRPESCPPEYVSAYKDQMTYRGFRHAMISTLRHMPLNDMSDVYAAVGKQQRPILLLWGKEDRITPFANSEKAMAVMPRAQLLPIEGLGHTAMFEGSDVVNPVLIEFLQWTNF